MRCPDGRLLELLAGRPLPCGRRRRLLTRCAVWPLAHAGPNTAGGRRVPTGGALGGAAAGRVAFDPTSSSTLRPGHSAELRPVRPHAGAKVTALAGGQFLTRARIHIHVFGRGLHIYALTLIC
jgi:hypothetical protein